MSANSARSKYILFGLLGCQLVCFFNPSKGFCADNFKDGGETVPQLSAPPSPLSTAPEKSPDKWQGNWFVYLGAGIGHPNYDDAIQGRIDDQKAQGGSSPEAGFFDLPGVYRKLVPGVALGAVLNMSFENVSGDFRAVNSYSVQTFNPSLSALYFPLKTFGQGLFFRGDLGASRIYQLHEYIPPNQSITHDKLIDDGIFTQAAVGYGWAATHVTRVLVHLNVFRSSAGTHAATGLSFNLGFLL
jgi:hypothetical protein